MTDGRDNSSGRAAAMRRAFDRSFAEPVGAAAPAMESLLSLRAGTQSCLVRLSEVAGLHAGKKITRLPGKAFGLLGIAGFRGAILPVYDLGVFLGHPPAPAPHWLLLSAAEPVALAFDEFERHLVAGRDEIAPRAADGGAGRHIREFHQTGGLVRPILRLASILDAIAAQARDSGSGEEQ